MKLMLLALILALMPGLGLAQNPDLPNGGVLVDLYGGFDSWNSKLELYEVTIARGDGMSPHLGITLGMPAGDRATLFLAVGRDWTQSEWDDGEDIVQPAWRFQARLRFYVGGTQ